jgi:hypothetical protein
MAHSKAGAKMSVVDTNDLVEMKQRPWNYILLLEVGHRPLGAASDGSLSVSPNQSQFEAELMQTSSKTIT